MTASVSREHVGLDQLAREARQGSSAAFDELARRVSPTLLSYLRRRCPTAHDAEDLCQETLVRVLDHLGSYDPDRPFEPWMLTIAGRLAIDRARRRPSPEPLPAELPAAEPRRTNDEIGAVLWQTAADILPASQYRAIRLRYVDGLDVRGVAAAIGVSVANAKVLLHRARKRLMASPTVRSLLDAAPDASGDTP